MSVRDLFVKLFSVYGNHSIGTNYRAVGASRAIVGVLGIGKMISFAVYKFFHPDHIGRTCDNAQLTALASFDIYHYSAFYLCHPVWSLCQLSSDFLKAMLKVRKIMNDPC